MKLQSIITMKIASSRGTNMLTENCPTATSILLQWEQIAVIIKNLATWKYG